MEIPNTINKIIKKENLLYEQLEVRIFVALQIVKEDVWKITIDKLIFPVELNNEELYELFKYFFLYQYKINVDVIFHYKKNEILIKSNKNSNWPVIIVITIIYVITMNLVAIALKLK